MDNKKKYTIYSSRAGTKGDLTLERNSNTDNFLSFLNPQCLILENTPDPSADLDSSDEWAKWLRHLDPNGQFSVTMQGPPQKKNIDSFAFKFNMPLLGSSPIVFSSSTDVLASSFGQNNIQSPGIEPNGELLYAGLDLDATSELKTTVRNVLDFVGDSVAIHFLPAPLLSLTLTLDVAKGTGKHNALWFSPMFYNQTTLRLHFKIDAVRTFKERFESHLTGLSIDEASVVCKKIFIRTTTAKGPVAVDQGGVAFTFGCTLNVKNQPSLILQTSADFRYNSVSLTVRPVSRGDVLETILRWLAQLVSVNLDDVGIVLSKDDIFQGVHLREVTVNLAVDENGKPTGISSFSISIQVSTKMGTGERKKAPLFLLTYRWEKDRGKVGELEGHFWNGSDLTSLPPTSPLYEWWKDLQPTPGTNPAESINLASIIPGRPIENIPEFIPTEMTAASLSLSDTKFGIFAIIDTEKPKDSNPPHPRLGLIQVRASYSWGKSDSGFSVELDIMSNLNPASTKPNPTTLAGKLVYDSATKRWLLEASLEGLYASSLYEFFDQGSSDHVMPLIDTMQIRNLTVRYEYEGGSGGRSAGSKFDINGALLIAGLELDLEFSYAKQWIFKASLKPQDAHATIGEVIAGIIGDNQVDLPDFVANAQFSQGNTFDIEVKKEESSNTDGALTEGGNEASKGSFHFIARISIGPIKLVFAQYHGGDWPAKTPSKRFFKVALQGLQIPEIKLIGKMEQPFDEMAFIWVQDPYTTKGLKGLTRKEVDNFNASLTDDPLVFKDKFKDHEEGDVLITAGSHFSINMKSASGEKSCLLMYDFKAGSKKKKPSQPGALSITEGKEENESEDEGATAQAPLKKKTGPLSLKNIGLKYANKQLHIIFDATFDLGPLEFSLLGFSIGLEISKLNQAPKVHPPTIEGLSLAFEKRPLTIAGIIRHGNTGQVEYFAGGLIVGFVPWEFVAAGFYGDAKLKDGTSFKSMFLFAKLNGPLFEIGFAEISGVTGGFGYNSEVRTPAPDQVVNFPFVATEQLEGKTGSPLETLQVLTSQGEDGWFHAKDKTYWAAAGLKVSAFQMLSVDAVVIVQFGQAIKLGVFAVAIADIPSTKVKLKFAHVELGLAVVVDFDYGTMKVEGQLSPNSFILHPDCHLTGGFGLYYWFDGPHADKSVVGEFVFTLGGYHQSFDIPDGYPRPPRLGISWSLSKALSITGEAYFAITPKVCMGGGRLHASFAAGPIEAWFDARADFLINYRPFTFTATISISVGVKFSIDVLFVHTSVSAELGASLTLWGPPVAGRVHVDFWVSSFDIDFGAGPLEPRPISLVEFYELVLQAGDKPQNLASLPAPPQPDENILTRPNNEGHTFLALSGLVNAGDKTERQPGDPWTVRAGTFSFSVNCKMAVKAALQGKNHITHERDIYSKPMQLETAMSSTLNISITQKGENNVSWRMEKQVKSVPTALWDKYNGSTDPSTVGNHIPSLLNTKNSTIPLMMGVVFNVPKPTLSPDKLPIAETADKNIIELKAAHNFPAVETAADEWEPAASSGKEQWDDVHKAWKTPSLGMDDKGQAGFVARFAEALHWDNSDSKLSKLAGLPKRMDKRFNDLFVAAPLISKG